MGGAAGAVTWNEEDGWGWDSRVLAGRLVGREAFADYLGTAAGTLISAGLGNGSSPNKLTVGASRLAAGLGEEATKWLYYLGAEASWNPDALDAGALAARALDDMGGLTVNLANVGAIVDALMLVNEGQGGYSAEQYKALALAAQRLAGSGMLELSIGSTGASLALGGRGVDVGGGAYSLAKGTVVQALIAAYDGSDELKEAMRQAYASGDYAAEATIWRVMAGTDRIIEGAVTDALARTVSDSSGSRTIAIGDVGEGRWGALDAAVRLQHEGWRNGTANDGNDRETLDATLAHTRLARALGDRNAGYLEQTGGLLAEVRMLGYTEQTGDLSMFARSVASRYDSSADYWRLVSLEGGGHALEFDGRSDICDEGWNFLVGTGTKGVQTALSSYLGVTMAEAAQIMQSAGMTPDAQGYWNRYTAGVNMGRRIPIAAASDPSLSSYLFTAYHQNQIMDEIAQVVADKQWHGEPRLHAPIPVVQVPCLARRRRHLPASLRGSARCDDQLLPRLGKRSMRAKPRSASTSELRLRLPAASIRSMSVWTLTRLQGLRCSRAGQEW